MIRCTDNAVELLRDAVRFDRAVRDGLADVVRASCEDGAEEARRVGAFKDQSGALRGSIVGRASGLDGEIEATAEHASFVEDDTRPHEIVPRRAKMLRWEDGDGVHFAHRVMHPGTKGKPFMGPASLMAERALEARATVLLARLGDRFSG